MEFTEAEFIDILELLSGMEWFLPDAVDVHHNDKSHVEELHKDYKRIMKKYGNLIGEDI